MERRINNYPVELAPIYRGVALLQAKKTKIKSYPVGVKLLYERKKENSDR